MWRFFAIDWELVQIALWLIIFGVILYYNIDLMLIILTITGAVGPIILAVFKRIESKRKQAKT